MDHAQVDPRELRRGDFPVLRELPTRWSDDDVYGHVNNVVHYLMFDTAVDGWLIEASGTDIRALPAIGVVVETSCRYSAELRFPEVVTAGIRLERLGTTSVVYRLALFPQPHAHSRRPADREVHRENRPAERPVERRSRPGRWMVRRIRASMYGRPRSGPRTRSGSGSG